MKTQPLLFFVLLLFCFQPAAGSRFGPTVAVSLLQRDWDCRISGKVVHKGQPLSGIQVVLIGPERKVAITDAEGRYEFKNLQPGSYQLRIVGAGFAAQLHTIKLEGTFSEARSIGEKKHFDVALDSIALPSPRPTPMPSVSATPTPTPVSTPTPIPTPRPSPIANTNANVRNLNANSRRSQNENTSANVSTNSNSNPLDIGFHVKATSASIDDQINALLKGKIVYEIPAVMSVGKSYVIKVGVGKRLTPDINSRAANSNVNVVDIPVNDVMDVDLIAEEANAFDVLRQEPKPGTSGWQVIGGDTASEWIFNVSPKQSGVHKLRLVASVMLNDPKNQNQPKSFNVYENDITVSSNYSYSAGEFIKHYWQWLMTVLLIPALGFGWKVAKNKLQPPPPARSDGPDEGD